MPYERLEDLRVYQTAVEIGNSIWDETSHWKFFEKDTLGKQIVRAADSISANIAESYGRTGTRDVVIFLMYARGSLYETKDHLEKAIHRKLVSAERGQAIQKQLADLAPSLNAFISAKRKSLRQRPTT